MDEQPKDDNKAMACIRCGNAMFECQVNSTGYYRFQLQPLDKGLLDWRSSDVRAFVCRNCYYTD